MTLLLQHRGGTRSVELVPCMVLDHEHYTKSTPTPKKSQPRSEFRQGLAASHNSRGVVLRDMGRLKEAEQDFDQSVIIRKQLVLELPFQVELRQELATSHNNRANLLSATGRLKEAEHDHDQAVTILKQLVLELPPKLSSASSWQPATTTGPIC